MSELDDRLRSAAAAVHEEAARLQIPQTVSVTHAVDDDRHRSGRLLVGCAAAVVVVLVASVAVVLVRDDGGGSNGGHGFSIEALAATTRRQSARFVMTSTVPQAKRSLNRTIRNCSFATGHCSTYAPSKPLVLVGTGFIDFQNGEGRIDLATRNSNGTTTRFLTELFVEGRVYTSIDPSTVGIPTKIRRTKHWIENKENNDALGRLSPFEPLALFDNPHIKLTDLGDTRIGDQTVHHYQGVPRTLVTPPTSGPSVTVTSAFDMYVDHGNRLVRMRTVDTQPHVGPSTSQLDFSDFGTHVEVTAPPADQVYVPPTTATPQT